MTTRKKEFTYSFIRVKSEDAHIVALYELLKKRIYNISNKTLPSFEEHRAFVLNNPYRAWYLVKSGHNFIGSVYILKDNCLGIFISSNDQTAIRASIEWIIFKHKPLSGIKSVRAPNYFVNVHPKNYKLISALHKIGATPIQISFSLNNLEKSSI